MAFTMPAYYEPYVTGRYLHAKPTRERIVLPFQRLPKRDPFALYCDPSLEEIGEYEVH